MNVRGGSRASDLHLLAPLDNGLVSCCRAAAAAAARHPNCITTTTTTTTVCKHLPIDCDAIDGSHIICLMNSSARGRRRRHSVGCEPADGHAILCAAPEAAAAGAARLAEIARASAIICLASCQRRRRRPRQRSERGANGSLAFAFGGCGRMINVRKSIPLQLTLLQLARAPRTVAVGRAELALAPPPPSARQLSLPR